MVVSLTYDYMIIMNIICGQRYKRKLAETTFSDFHTFYSIKKRLILIHNKTHDTTRKTLPLIEILVYGT